MLRVYSTTLKTTVDIRIFVVAELVAGGLAVARYAAAELAAAGHETPQRCGVRKPLG